MPTKKKKNAFQLDFEKPLQTLYEQIDSLQNSTSSPECQSMVHALQTQFDQLKNKLYANLEPHQKLQIARHPDRPHILDYLPLLGTDWIELHGDRMGADDGAIVGGLLRLKDGQTVMLIGTDKGHALKDKQKRNFGMPQPWGYRKAMRLCRHAEKFSLPVLTLIDTPGAYPGLEAEAQGQSGAIAQSIQEMSALSVPVLAIITGEGGSGGALALGVANRVCMLEHAVYSVISPEGCAAILWRTRDKYVEAAKALKITANELFELGLIDEVIAEPSGGAHQDPAEMGKRLQKVIADNLARLGEQSPQQLKTSRQQKFRNYGAYVV